MHTPKVPDSARYRLEQLKEIANKPGAEISDVVEWFSENINWLCTDILGAHGRQLNNSVSYKTSYDERDGKPLIITMLQWQYEGIEGDPPDIEALAPYIDDIEISVDNAYQTTLGAELTLEADKWQNLLPTLIFDTAKFAFHSDSGIPSLRKIAAKDTLKFVRCLVPKMTQEVFDFAVENGMFEKKELCLGWLAQTQLIVPSVVLPSDFEPKST